MAEAFGGFLGASVGGFVAGTAMAGLFSETGIGSMYAGMYGYVVGSYMGHQIGVNLATGIYDTWYNLYYNCILPIRQMENYNNSLQFLYQPF